MGMERLLALWLCMAGHLLFAQRQAGENASDFFPIAVWAQNPEHASAYRAHGINMYINIHGGLDAKKLALLKEAGMRVIAHQNSYGLTQSDEPLIYGWMHGDEPDNAQRSKTQKGKWEPCLDPADIIRAYQRIRKNDPSRPVYLNVGRGVAYTDWVGRGVCRGRTDMYKTSNNGYLKGCDIASFDIYPVNSREEDVKGRLWYVAKGIDSLKAWSDYSKPVWCWIETTRISEKSERKPTPAEVKSQVWMALIHGANGFGYFCHSFADPSDDAALLHDYEMIQAVKSINAQVTSLAPILNMADTRGYASVKTSDKAIPIDIMTKRDGRVNYVFAVAMRPGETQATFRVKSGKHVEVLGEDRTIGIKRGRFTDRFSDYGVHLYRIVK